MTDTWLIVGLGNPGPRYAATRHNVGFLVADALADRAGVGFKSHKAHALIAETRLTPPPAPKTVLAKPLSFMNLSGGPVSALLRYFSVPVSHVIVIHDELDIPFGALRLKRGGGDNGHNGLRSITKALGTPDYLRVRVGIGRPIGERAAADYVLSDFAVSERVEAAALINDAADATVMLLDQELSTVQNQYHSRITQ